MKKNKGTAVIAVILLTASLFTGCSMYTYRTAGIQTSYSNPQWAPPFYAGARYYYLPDLETYYDLSENEFIFLDHGRWVYSKNIPSMYVDYDLNDCFTVVLNVNIYRPWMHHQYYVSHYPRYYYRDYYDHSNIPYVRGFNENRRSAIYWGENERHRARSWDNQNLKNERNFKYQKEDRQYQKDYNKQNEDRSSLEKGKTQRRPVNTDATRSPRTNRSNKEDAGASTRSTESTRVQSTNYYGRTIGNPVKVEKQMQEKRTAKTKTTKSTGRR